MRPGARAGRVNRANVANPFIDLDELVAEPAEPVKGLDLLGQLGERRARPKLAGLGLPVHLASKGEVGPMAGVPRVLATAGGLPTFMTHARPACDAVALSV